MSEHMPMPPTGPQVEDMVNELMADGTCISKSEARRLVMTTDGDLERIRAAKARQVQGEPKAMWRIDPEILQAAVEHWGLDTQDRMAVGELGELLALFGRDVQGRASLDEWADEIADGLIMLTQLARVKGVAERVQGRIDVKMARMLAKIERQRQ